MKRPLNHELHQWHEFALSVVSRPDVSVMISFHHKKTVLDAHLLTPTPKIPQKFSPPDRSSPQGAEDGERQAGGSRPQVVTDPCSSRTTDYWYLTAEAAEGRGGNAGTGACPYTVPFPLSTRIHTE
jgi:hypothetical protein